MTDATQLTISDQVATLELSRPEKHNAFNDTIIDELRHHIRAVSRSDARVLVLRAQGKNFCAGADLNWMKRMADLSHQENLHDARQLAGLMQELNELPIPAIARVQGAAYGGAIGLIACCDIALASEGSRFCLSETKLGLAPATIGPYVVAAIGPRIARKLFLTAEVFDAKAAQSYQLVHETCPSEDLDALLDKHVSMIKATGPLASKAAKKLVADIASNDDDLIELTSELIADLRVSEEGQSGLRSFFAKENPPWLSNESS